jgi:cytosine/uracil/thiamine/allantoin permease
MSNISQNNVTIIIAVITVMLVGTTISNSVDYTRFARKEKNQIGSQPNTCGNEELPLNVVCETTTSQVDGEENAVVINGNQIPSTAS